ncbi:MAG: hypothetical protein HC771_07820 [Synechococcales cyanobacterium CRU_2_2]|nr:hypothetical protein [Synechococcales cyanobacterium CRU_2_2]
MSATGAKLVTGPKPVTGPKLVIRAKLMLWDYATTRSRGIPETIACCPGKIAARCDRLR